MLLMLWVPCPPADQPLHAPCAVVQDKVHANCVFVTGWYSLWLLGGRHLAASASSAWQLLQLAATGPWAPAGQPGPVSEPRQQWACLLTGSAALPASHLWCAPSGCTTSQAQRCRWPPRSA